MTAVSSRFATAILARRRALKLQQQDVAAAACITKSYLHDLERGRRASPPDDLMARLATALDCSADELYIAAGRLPPDCRGRLSTEALALLRSIQSV